MDLKERKAKVVSMDKDGESLSVEWTRENGERVIGMFSLFGWRRAPTAEYARFHEAQANGPQAVLRPSRRRAPRPRPE